MAQRRKLQVFVSSTYLDLKEERQAAVEAILTAGHIPAGMELFSAGEESQMAVIRRWIDESDAYLLLLGGRYGSIDKVSGKSYTHLEYEYAVEKGKALFALVITDEHLEAKNRKKGSQVLERENYQKLKDFKSLVTNKLVKFWSDKRDIQLAIMQTLSDFDRRPELVGWVPGSESTNSGAIAEEIARLTKENAVLREQLDKSSTNNSVFNGLKFDDLYQLLSKYWVDESKIKESYLKFMNDVAKEFQEEGIIVLHYFWILYYINNTDSFYTKKEPFKVALLDIFEKYNLVSKLLKGESIYEVTILGSYFIKIFDEKHNTSEVHRMLGQFRSLESINTIDDFLPYK